MHVPRDARFEEESRRFGLRYACEDCGYFDEAAGRCRHEWPVALHRRPREGETRREVVFCKEFELR